MSRTDKELLDAIRQKEELAFTELYTKYWRLLYIWTSNRIHDREIVRDLLQNVWADIWQRPDIIKTNVSGSARNILLSFVTFRILDHYKKKEILIFEDDIEVSNRDQSYSHILEELEVKDLQLLIENAIAKLPQLSRDIYLLSEKQNLPVSQIAQKLSITEETVKRRLKWINIFIRSNMEKQLNIDRLGAILIIMYIKTMLK